MQNKERLISFEEPLRFIFSHSALVEGWDNPNVFTICNLQDGKSEMRKRQQIGRGLRLPVMENGERCRVDDVNMLTVIAYEEFSSMIGIGDLLGAEFLAATAGTLSAFASADHLAGYAGLAPAPRDSGRRTGNLHRPRRYNRQMQRVFYTSALISIQHSPASKAFYDRKRAEGKRHSQAVLALARRRVNVLWAILRDQSFYVEPGANRALAA